MPFHFLLALLEESSWLVDYLGTSNVRQAFERETNSPIYSHASASERKTDLRIALNGATGEGNAVAGIERRMRACSSPTCSRKRTLGTLLEATRFW